MSLLTPLVGEYLASDPPRWERTVAALNKLLLLDAQLGLEGYSQRREENLEFLNQELVRSGRRLAHDYERQGAELRQTTARAREAENLASIGTLVAGLAHEIGTPMGVIQGHAKLLEQAVSDDSAKWRLRTIQAQISRISMIIKSLLNMARPSRSSRVPVALEPLIDNTMAFLSERLQRRKIRVERSFEPVSSLNGDPERLQQLFLNLFINAADAMVNGGELRISLGPTPAGEIEIVVADSGPGIPEEHLGRIFDPFFTTKAAGEGNGLGLAVAHGIVQDYGGVIEARSALGKGTEFRITFPGPAAIA
jgi:signal transduction histidine kinase